MGGILLCAVRASAEPAPRPPNTPIFFDAREPFARPMVRVSAFGHTRTMLLDTGTGEHVMGLRSSGLPTGAGESEVIGRDYLGRPFSGVRVPDADVRLPGWPALGELWFSEWADRNHTDRATRPGEPAFAGVLSPLGLAGADRVVVLDFTTATLSAGSWDEAATRLLTADQAMTPSPLPIDGGSSLIVPIIAGGHELRLALDTGAQTSTLWVPRGADLPDGLTRISARAMQVRAGEVTSSVRFKLVESIEPIDSGAGSPRRLDGVLGMDVLHTCILALDRQYFAVRCLSDKARNAASAPARPPPLATRSDLVAMRTSRRQRDSTIQIAGNRGQMRQRAAGGYEWTGEQVAARIRRDGRLSFSRAPKNCPEVHTWNDDWVKECATVHTEMDADEERRWFEDHVGDLVVALARAHEREEILDALAALPRQLSAILDDRRLSPAQRRRILFLLWDEMAEPDDTERGWAGARARRRIDAFVQERLPAGSPGAYTAAELAAFNRTRRRDEVRFDPYAAPDRRRRDRDDGDSP
jgi:hypothetical protein